MAERKKRLRAYAKVKRAEIVNRDQKERLLVENCLTALRGIFEKTTGASTRLTVFVYLSYSSEAATDSLIEALLHEGYKVVCPRVEGDEMYAVAFGEDFTLSEKGIREPTGCVYEGEIHASITPLLAVDKQGNRVGYGGGYYDRFFARYPQMKRIGYCFDAQVAEDVPSERTDVRLDCVLTEERVFFPTQNE